MFMSAILWDTDDRPHPRDAEVHDDRRRRVSDEPTLVFDEST
jgi:hypothetical protein